MNRLNRYAHDGSILSLLPNPLTRVDLSEPWPQPEPNQSATTGDSGSRDQSSQPKIQR